MQIITDVINVLPARVIITIISLRANFQIDALSPPPQKDPVCDGAPAKEL